HDATPPFSLFLPSLHSYRRHGLPSPFPTRRSSDLVSPTGILAGRDPWTDSVTPASPMSMTRTSRPLTSRIWSAPDTVTWHSSFLHEYELQPVSTSAPPSARAARP